MSTSSPPPITAERLEAVFPPHTLPRAVIPILADHLQPIEVPPGQAVVVEGAHDRAMYFVLEGTARMEKGGMALGSVGPGEHFGEIALVVERPRGATVTAEVPMLLGRLDRLTYHRMLGTAPELGAMLLEQVVGSLAERLQGMTESVGVLIRDRALPRRTTVELRVQGIRRTVKNGTRVGTLLPSQVGGAPVVAALVDHRAVSLSAPVSGESVVEALTTAHWEGLRIFRRSLGLLALEAAERLDPSARLRMGPSLGFAQQLQLEAGGPASALAAPLAARMAELVGRDAPLSEELWTVKEAREYFGRVGCTDSVRLLEVWRDGAVPMASYGAAYALALGPFLPSAAPLVGFRVVADDGGLLLVHDAAAPSDAPPLVTRVEAARAVSRQSLAMTRTHERWMHTLGVTSVGDFNRASVRGDVARIVRVVEGFQEKEIGRIADEITQRKDRVRVVCVAGPSSSGKTTFIKRLTVQLLVNGVNPVGLSLDDYYVDRERTPRDARGEWDFEAFEALQSDLLQAQVGALLRGERTPTARYDFKAGQSHPEGGPVRGLGPDEVLMLEGIHGLNPRLLSRIPEGQVFRIFICPLAQLAFDRLTRVHASDIRLLRRIVRDRHGRNHDAAETIRRWPLVRAGERRHIFPHQAQADVVLDSSLVYEPSVLKVFAERYLLEVPEDHEAYPTAFRLLQLVDRFVAIYPDHVPQNSLLREFIGHSGFTGPQPQDG
ncbi:MAG: cyclic nucleotide-binding domain-containing protein [Deltaproteobacteria bacterium]|nr:cyclic nucleotide-binding domain-containing protein [Deltaproteobacteria bacterium]